MVKSNDMVLVERGILAAASYIIRGTSHADSNTAGAIREASLSTALSGLSLPGRDADAREALGDQTQSVQLAEVSPPISGDAASDMLILSHARMRCALEGIREHVAHGRLGDWSIALTEIKKLVDGALGQHPTPEQGK